MVDHQSTALQRQSNQQPYHSHFQSQYRNKYHQDIHGPLSAGVVEGGQRAFAGFHNHSLPYPPQSSSSLSLSTAVPSSSSSSSLSSSRGSLSVADILERYKDASKDFIMSVLNAKAKEDERKAEEERYKTEQIKLQSKQLELDLALGKRRGSPPAYVSSGSSGQYSYYSSSYSSYPSDRLHRSNSSSNNKHPHHESAAHISHEHQDHPQSTHQSSQYSHHDQHMSQPSPQSRPPLKINTSVRQYHPQPQSSQRLPPSPHSTLPPLPANNPPKSSRHFGLPSMASSAQSSPVAVVDYQSHIPPPLTPKEEHVSPTSAISPTQGQTLKRKSVNHDAVMDAVRAKVLRNAAGQNQQQQQQQQQQRKDSERDLTNKRKSQVEKSSPELPKIDETDTQEDRSERPDSKLEGPLLSSLPSSISPPGTETRSSSASPTSSSSIKPRGQTSLETDEDAKSSAHDTVRRRSEHTMDEEK